MIYRALMVEQEHAALDKHSGWLDVCEDTDGRSLSSGRLLFLHLGMNESCSHPPLNCHKHTHTPDTYI